MAEFTIFPDFAGCACLLGKKCEISRGNSKSRSYLIYGQKIGDRVYFQFPFPCIKSKEITLYFELDGGFNPFQQY